MWKVLLPLGDCLAGRRMVGGAHGDGAFLATGRGKWTSPDRPMGFNNLE
jgi:hypothetical protein